MVAALPAAGQAYRVTADRAMAGIAMAYIVMGWLPCCLQLGKRKSVHRYVAEGTPI